MAKPRAILTGEGTTEVQGEFAGFEQKRVQAIETWAAKYDAKREECAARDGELKNFELKLREAMHGNEDKVDHQESEDGDKILVYKRGDYNIVVKRGKESVNVKIKEKSKGDAPTEGDE